MEPLLGSYKALDLADERGYFCGKILADLGADVIKIEKPGGDFSRRIGPFYHDKADTEKSLSWLAYNTSKRGITLNIEKEDGKEILRRLIERSDVLVESFAPGYLKKLGLGYSSLKKLNKGLIMASISPFGEAGPYGQYKADDLTVSAMGGLAYVTGDADRPPVRISFPQCFNMAAANAAVAIATALYHREGTGRGQHIDVSAQECQLWTLMTVIPIWEQRGRIIQRSGAFRRFAMGQMERQTWPCKDGYVSFVKWGGAVGGARSNRALVEWMDSEGMATEYVKNMDWDAFDMATCTQETHDKTGEAMGKFFLSHTKSELYEGAINRRILLYPAFGMQDLLQYEQLKARHFWEKVEHEELGDSITYPGAFAKIKTAPLKPPKRAPRIGEHNEEIYLKEMGMSKEEYLLLKQAGVI